VGAGRRSLALALALLALPAAAHIVYGTRTLGGLVAESDLVLRARIVSVGGLAAEGRAGAGVARPTVLAEVQEVLKGSLEVPSVRFAQHGHGVARFQAGDEALVFLRPIARSRELDALEAQGIRWFSTQEHDEAYRLTPATRGPLLEATRGYVAVGASDSADARLAALRRAHLALLTSGDAKLAASSLRDLVVTPQPVLTAADLPALDAVLGDAETSMGVRVALLAELERRGLLEGRARWLKLLAPGAPSRDRVTAVRGAASCRDVAVRARLVELVADRDPLVASAAAIAVGAPGREAAVAPLTRALDSESPRVRMAAIRGLGRIDTASSRAALAKAAASNPDPAIRGRAEAELR